MPTSFSRLDLPSPEALDHVLKTVLDHATSLLRQQLELDGLSGEQEEQVCQRVLEAWMQDAKQRLSHNLSIEGVGWREWEASSQAIAPLDTQLANRLANLSRTVDELSEEIVLQRRDLPQRHAEALKAREEVLESFQDQLQRQRKDVLEHGWGGHQAPPEIPVARQDEVAKTLSSVLSQADSLAEILPTQLSAAEEQYELVTQLRSMPP
ncbi:unnamed protein product [Parajaminaea phylloscopi]